MTHPISPSSRAVEFYMCQHGWQPTQHPNPRLRVLSGPLDDFGNPVSLVLPASDDLADASLRVDEVIRSLAMIEDRPVDALLSDIQPSPPSVTRSQAQDGTAILHEVVQRLEHLEAIAQHLLAEQQGRRKRRSPKKRNS